MSEKAQVTVSIPDETRDELDREADRRGTHRSATVVQIVDEWNERGETIPQLRDELGEVREDRARLSAQLEEAEERAADNRAPWTVRTAWRLLSVTLLSLGAASVALGFMIGGVTLGAVTPGTWALVGALAAAVGLTASAGTVALGVGELGYQLALGDADDALGATVEAFRSDLETEARG